MRTIFSHRYVLEPEQPVNKQLAILLGARANLGYVPEFHSIALWRKESLTNVLYFLLGLLLGLLLNFWIPT